MRAGKRLIVAAKGTYTHGSLSIFLFAVLTVIAFTVAFQQFYIINYNTVTRYSLAWHIPFNLFYFWYWFLVYPVIYWTATRHESWKSSISSWVLCYLLIPAAMVIVHQVVASLLINFFLGYSDFNTLFYKRMIRNAWIGIDLVIYFAILTAVKVVSYQKGNEAIELRINQLQGQLARSQLSALESQLHPHFLFNTLNTLSTLILKKDNVEARRMLSLLQGFLRTTVYGGDRHEITLEEELRFINQYLEIEKVRFNDRLEVEEDIAHDTLIASVPKFLLQPIVENAIRHAIAPRVSKGLLKITASKKDKHLVLLVEDDGPGLASFDKRNLTEGSRTGKEGVRLRIAKERLGHIFGEHHVFELGKSSLGGLKVEIQVPFVESHVEPESNSERVVLIS